MIENSALPSQPSPAVDQPEGAASPVPALPSPAEERKARLRMILVIGAVLLVIGGVIASVVMLVQAGPQTAALVRDIFIIFLGLISLLVMAALIILIIQLAILINLLQNEIKPILRSTTDTVNNLRGTTTFISNNLVEPIIKLNESLAGLRRFFDLIRPGRS